MRLPVPFVRLALRFDAERLAAEAVSLPDRAWRPHPQGMPGNSSLALVSRHGDPTDDASWGAMRPTPHLERLPYTRQVLAALGTVVGRTRYLRVEAESGVDDHVDTNHYWREHLRIHVPVVTNDGVRFRCGGEVVHMAAGEAWTFDTWRRHAVENPSATARIHLVVDTVGTPELWRMIEAPGDQRAVPFEPDAEPALVFERVNRAPVMTPWELELHAEALLRELPAAADLAAVVRDAVRAWRAVWAVHGDAEEARPRYEAVRDRLDEALVPAERKHRLPNGVDAVEALRQVLVRPVLHDDTHAGAAPRRPAPTPAPRPSRLDRPVFLVSPPRSGSTLLFETLARSPDAWTIGGESHQVVETIPALNPANTGYGSNRLVGADATPHVARLLEAGFLARARDREGREPPADGTIRLLEKTPKNALRVPFLEACFPDARFVYVYRDPRETLSSMLDAWRSGRFRTYPRLPGWRGAPWSLLLVPGWRELSGRALAEVVAHQWARTTSTLLDDLEALGPDRWCVASYDRLVAEPQAEVERLCAFLELGWDEPLEPPLPLARHALSAPDPDKWRRNATEIEEIWPIVRDVARRAHAVFAEPPASRPARRAPSAEAPRPAQGQPDPEAFRSVHTPSMVELLERAGCSLAVTTYQSGRLVLVRARDGALNTHLRFFRSPMGVAAGGGRLTLGTKTALWSFRNQPAVAAKVDPPGTHDACFIPRGAHVTGDIRIHEIVDVAGELWAANTRFSCLSTFEPGSSFVPRWRPPFVTALAAEDRCHLNGIAVRDGAIRSVTCLAVSDDANGWRDHKVDGGVVLDVPSGEVVAAGLSMPHSPRWHDGTLWVLESGKGEVNVVDEATGGVETVARLPGFTRGLAFVGPYALVGLSQVRESVFGGIPLAERLDADERRCGVWLLDTRTGETVGLLRFDGIVQEVFDVQVLPGLRWPELVEPEADLVDSSFVVPDAALADVPR